MIVECPSCSTKFRLGLDRFKSEKAKVRCSKCKHVFDVAKPVEASGEDLPPAGAQEKSDGAGAKKKTGLKIPGADKIASKIKIPNIKVPDKLGFLNDVLSSPKKRLIVGGSLALLVILIVLFSIMGSSSEEEQEQDQQETAAVEQTDPGNERISLDGVSGEFVETQGSGKLFAIKGLTQNNYSYPVRHIRLEGLLLASTTAVVQEKAVFAGNPFSADELRTLAWEQIDSGQNTASGRDGLNEIIPPGEKIPFTIVFKDLPEDLAQYTVRVLDSKRADD